MFRYEEYQIRRELSVFIKKLWTLNNLNDSLPVLNKSVLPNGCFNIAFIQGLGLQIKHQNIDKLLPAGVYFCGQMTEALSVSIEPFTKATMVQLYPWTPVHFISANLSLYTDQIVPTTDMGFVPFNNLKIVEGLTYSSICRQVIAAFNPLLNFSTASSLILRGTQMIVNTHGNTTIIEVATTLNCSVRYLQKLFKTYIGLTPKQLAVIIKLRDAVDDIAYPGSDSATLTRLALANRFYDQAHFNNTFQAIVKTSPNKFHVPDYFLSFKN
ncbi:MAG: AraC family transcriptional regulator [Mucilaginibacter sp.]|uniref:AraC family transcriptional regulator n=1 Tax=Mucilaginibacter sp. TaxID=1882438 RepID=UPI0034E5FA9C